MPNILLLPLDIFTDDTIASSHLVKQCYILILIGSQVIGLNTTFASNSNIYI